MTSTQRFEVWADFMRQLSLTAELIPVTKVALRAAFDAADQWTSDNAASFNLAIPQPARAALSPSQKALILMLVVAKRFKVGV